MNVLVIPEDYRNDQYVLQPIVRAIMTRLGRPRAEIKICRNPLLRGVDQATDWDRLRNVFNRNPMVDLYLLCVDRDGLPGRRARLDRLEEQAPGDLRPEQGFLAENAWEEIEVWVLAGHVLPGEWTWETIREELHPKELYFDDLARRRGLSRELGGGRKTLAQDAARRYDRIRQLCPEDVLNLEKRVGAWLEREV